MTRGLTLRPATPADAPALVALINSAYRGDSSRAGWTTEADLLDGQRVDVEGLTETITTPGNVILLYGGDLEPVACVLLERTGADCYLGLLTIQPTAQGAGLGRQMLDAAERWAVDEWSSQTMHMTVIVQRTELIDWYQRRGYHRTGIRKAFPYGDERFGLPRRDDLEFEVLRKDLSAVSGLDRQ
jgi:ribosomal protein S18 acetylase RimI-like enzyme